MGGVRKTVISQLQSVGEEALGKLAQSPATRTAIQGAVQVKERGERLLHAIDSIDARLESIEQRLGVLEGKATKPVRRATAKGTDAPSPPTAVRKPKPAPKPKPSV